MTPFAVTRQRTSRRPIGRKAQYAISIADRPSSGDDPAASTLADRARPRAMSRTIYAKASKASRATSAIEQKRSTRPTVELSRVTTIDAGQADRSASRWPPGRASWLRLASETSVPPAAAERYIPSITKFVQ